MPGLRQLRVLPRRRRASLGERREIALRTTALVAWQLSAGSESAALCFLLLAGAVNLRKQGRRQTQSGVK